MKHKSLENRLGIRWIWFLTYAAVLAFSLVSILFCYGILSGELKTQLKERNNATLKTIAENVDSQFKMIKSAAAQIATDEEVAGIVEKITLPIDSKENFELFRFVSDLRTLKGWSIAEDLSEDLMIYFPHIDRVTRQGTVHDSQSFYETYCKEGNIAEEEWHNFLTNRHDNEYINMRLFKNEDELIYVTSVSPNGDRSSFVNLIFKINKERLSEKCESLYFRDYGLFAVADKDDNILMSFMPKKEGLFEQTSLKKLKTEKGVCSFEAASELNSWKYVYVLPESIAYKSIKTTKCLIIIVLLTYLALSTVMILYFIRIHEKPIKNIIKSFPNTDESDEAEAKGGQNEYMLLSDKIRSVTDKNFEMAQALEKQQSVLKKYLLNLLLTGSDADEKMFGTLHFNPDSGKFAAVVISTEPVPEENNRLKIWNETEKSYLYFSICNILDELLGNQQYAYHSAEKENGVVYVVEIKDEMRKENLVETAVFAHEVVLEELGFDFTLILGETYKGREGIARSYKEARLAMGYAEEKGITGIKLYKDLKEELAKKSSFSEKQVKLLHYAILKGDKKIAEKVIEEIFTLESTESQDVLYRHLAQSVNAAVKKILLLHAVSFNKEFSEFKGLGETEETPEKIKAQCKKLVFKAMAKLYEQKKSEDVVDRCIIYIGENYKDINLSLKGLAGEFGITHEYLSKKFKQKAEISLVDYINLIRIEHAKALMCQKGCQLSEIPEKVGFSNYRTFARQFISFVGVAPKEFKIK